MQFTIPLQPTYWEGHATSIYSPEVCVTLKSDNSHKQTAANHPAYSTHPWALPVLSKHQGTESSLP